MNHDRIKFCSFLVGMMEERCGKSDGALLASIGREIRRRKALKRRKPAESRFLVFSRSMLSVHMCEFSEELISESVLVV